VPAGVCVVRLSSFATAPRPLYSHRRPDGFVKILKIDLVDSPPLTVVRRLVFRKLNPLSCMRLSLMAVNACQRSQCVDDVMTTTMHGSSPSREEFMKLFAANSSLQTTRRQSAHFSSTLTGASVCRETRSIQLHVDDHCPLNWQRSAPVN
jgi:hypothetical protein